MKCHRCGGCDFVEDGRSGDTICGECGVVFQEKRMSEETEYRLFRDDTSSQKRQRVGPSYNPYITSTISNTVMSSTRSSCGFRQRHYTDENFLELAYKDIDETFMKLYNGQMSNMEARNNARYMFSLVYRAQKAKKDAGVRKKFSMRKQFVVACVFRALFVQNDNMTRGMNPQPGLAWSLREISNMTPGIDVSTDSVKRCQVQLHYLLNP